MTRYLALVALAGITASAGCQNVVPGGRPWGPGVPSHVTQSQMAPRPEILRTAYHQSVACFTGDACGYGGACGCGEAYGCADTCGYGGACAGCGGGGHGGVFAGMGASACGWANGEGCCGCGGGPPGCGFCNRQCGPYQGHGGYGLAHGAVETVASGCCARSGDHIYDFNPGPPVGQVTYPYYTVRGPRDFLRDNPPPLGPY